jgi:hypothetical protein
MLLIEGFVSSCLDKLSHRIDFLINMVGQSKNESASGRLIMIE